MKIDSHSSKKRIASWIFASRNTSLRIAPAWLVPRLGKLIISTFFPIIEAKAFAIIVFPVPLGP